ncbi:hypothetical protein PoB_003257700 [Plakobranchus ocellatus]|uniref:Uncharacterized protein n=1 Tax=Plakobranchus ocellatus TaxID=259542 RepID=A0AAV4AGP2_9GAST|nr:hypothetical protein PoB_003257700 [Plakobranchus ocellatus]
MHKDQFQLEISHRFNALEENKPTIETFHKIMEEEAERFGKNGKDKPNEKLKEDMEIERKGEKTSRAYTPDQWYTAVRAARVSKQPYKVKEMTAKDFVDFKSMSNNMKNLAIGDDGQKIMWSRTRQLFVMEEDRTPMQSSLQQPMVVSPEGWMCIGETEGS